MKVVRLVGMKAALWAHVLVEMTESSKVEN
jgi:hypothetical protein